MPSTTLAINYMEEKIVSEFKNIITDKHRNLTENNTQIPLQ